VYRVECLRQKTKRKYNKDLQTMTSAYSWFQDIYWSQRAVKGWFRPVTKIDTPNLRLATHCAQNFAFYHALTRSSTSPTATTPHSNPPFRTCIPHFLLILDFSLPLLGPCVYEASDYFFPHQKPKVQTQSNTDLVRHCPPSRFQRRAECRRL
jgi:hypothetical protein